VSGLPLSIVIPTLNAQDSLPELLSQVAGYRVVVSDGGSTDATLETALTFGACLALGTPGRGQQLARGAELAVKGHPKTLWLLFVHADTKLPVDWESQVAEHMAAHPDKAAYFRFGGEGPRLQLSLMRLLIWLRETFWYLPYGDQGLLMSASLYQEIGGYLDMSIFEDVDIATRIKRAVGPMRRLPAAIYTDLSAYHRDGFWRRGWRNIKLLYAYRRGVSVEDLLRRYHAKL